ncbi:MAG: polyphosphate:AMP phosphotransferase [Bacillota bacterium]
MLEKVDLSKRIEKDGYKEIISDLQMKLGGLQRQAKDLKIPVLILFEGWDAAGKGTLINKLILNFDPRGFKVYSILDPTEEEKLRPLLWRFWTKIPAKGRISIFDRSWYKAAAAFQMDGQSEDNLHKNLYSQIKSFERQLADDDCVIMKFFLHISKEEQKKRFKDLEDCEDTAWRVTKEDWENHKKYKDYQKAFEVMMETTDASYAPWTIVEAHDRRFATIKIFTTVIDALEKKIQEIQSRNTIVLKPEINLDYRIDLNSSILDKIDLSKALTKEEYEEKLKKYQKRLREIEHTLYIKRIPMMILYEGWDAAGKGGNIRRLTESLDPRGYEVIPIAAPNDLEKSHHYLWRFWNAVPKAGHIAIFDRTWYGRVLVERVEGFAGREEWKRAYKEINEMEEQLANYGTILVKFWLHIDKEEQLKRFEERQHNPYKQWKITEEDWRNREKWDAYKEAVDEMLFRTSTTYAPWTIVESNDKYYARVKALKTIIDTAEKLL